ncbi:hypothetical protein DHC50_12405 [Arenibacter sp. A80]|nr:hypothetical protein [Arenibacter sp. A80]RFT56173.1 hypothetical protein D0S24_12405 [Arenibacter sp. P308M17]
MINKQLAAKTSYYTFAHCPLPIAYCSLFIAHCPFPLVFYRLFFQRFYLTPDILYIVPLYCMCKKH